MNTVQSEYEKVKKFSGNFILALQDIHVPAFFQALYHNLPKTDDLLCEHRLIRGYSKPFFYPLDQAGTVHTRKNEQGFNIYHGINLRFTREPQHGTKYDVSHVVALHVDIDAKDYLLDPYAKAQEDIDAILPLKGHVQEELLATCHDTDFIPSIVVDSGRGFQLYYLLQEPVALPCLQMEEVKKGKKIEWQRKSGQAEILEQWNKIVDQIERLNKGLNSIFTHADSTHNIDRVFRTPGSLNMKPRRKTKKSLVKGLDPKKLKPDDLTPIRQPAQILWFHPEIRYTLDEFESLCEHMNPSPVPTGNTPHTNKQGSGLSDHEILQRIQHKNPNVWKVWNSNGNGDRSEAVFDVLCTLAYWTGKNAHQMERLFEQSPLCQAYSHDGKWQRLKDNEIQKAITSQQTIYTGNGSPIKKSKKSEPPYKFWYWEGEKTSKLKINRKKFLEFLEQSGFGMIRVDDRIKFVRVRDHVVSDCLIDHGQNIDVKRFTIRYLQQYQQAGVENAMLRGHYQYFTLSALNTLPFLNLTFCQDTKDAAYLFFQNGAIEIAKDQARLIPYAKLSGYIWEKHILPYNYAGRHVKSHQITKKPTGDFWTFLNCITVNDQDKSMLIPNPDKLDAFISAYGYLLYGWKDSTEAKAVVCVDNTIGAIDDDGRTGKSLLCESLKYLKNVHTEPGKTWNPEDRFAFQNVDLDTQIMFIDDISRKFHFNALYPSITGDMACEGKWLKRIVMPFSDSPKFVLTTNAPVRGEGTSDKARQCVLPFSRFFSLEYTPKDYFKHQLFFDWKDQDWQEFFDCAIYAVNFYLNNGLKIYTDPTYDHFKLQREVPEEALVYFAGLTTNIAHNKATLIDSLKEAMGNKRVYSRSVTRWLKIYCKYTNLQYEEWRTTERNNGSKENVTFIKLIPPETNN